MPRRAREQRLDDELLFFEAEHDHAEEYLEALAMLEQEGVGLAPVSHVARRLRVKPPSAVEMLKRLAGRGLVEYVERRGVRLTAPGRRIGRRMVRNGRLMEVFMTSKLRIPLDIRVAHSIEHSMSDAFADALCSLLRHPRRCPHGYPVPPGRCCPRARARGGRAARAPGPRRAPPTASKT